MQPAALRATGAVAWLSAVVLLGACQKSIYRDYRIPTSSMEPTFAQFQRVTVRHIPPGAKLRRGDVIVFRQPEQEQRKYMKRVVGLAGDVVEVEADRLVVNGDVQAEPYARYTRPLTPFGPFMVPAGTLFVLGDNRAHSLDSRHFGSVPRQNVIGIVTR